MPLAPGRRLGPYEIVAPLGAGGMGEVYRARDTRLGREVAIKVLSQHLSASPEVRARFEREARTISALNHPHICVLHDIGRDGDTDFIVMELVEGETLAARLAHGALAVSEVLKVGAQIADALDRAHRAGVTHRDLKPGNVMLTKSGAKLMDFGLARGGGGMAESGAASGAGLTHSPTMTQPLTAEGAILGTFQYMAPEQLEGREADARSDLWALGCVLYEMATGRRAFEGKSQASLIAAIMHVEPQPVSRISPLSPPALDRLVSACLAKDPADRVQSAHDVKLQLGWIADGAAPASGIVTAQPAAGPPRARRALRIVLGFIAFWAVMVTTATLLSRRDRPGRHAAPQRYVVGDADLIPLASPVLSPDGMQIVFAARDGATSRLYRRSLSSFDMTPIPGTDAGAAPFFSPDGAWIGFVTSADIRKVPSGGGPAQVIAVEPRIGSCKWGRDGTIYFTPRDGGRDGLTALARVRETGGKVDVVARLDSAGGEAEAWLPDVLPDGRTVIYSAGSGNQWRIVATRADGSRRTVVEKGFIARYSRPGYLLYLDMDSEALLAAPFDAAKATVTGPAVPLTERVDLNYAYDIAPDGKILYVPRPGTERGDEIVWIDRKGAITPMTDIRSTWTEPRVAPDGKRILVRKTGPSCELWMLDLERGTQACIVQAGDNHHPIWSPDGRQIAWQRVSPPASMVALTVEGARHETTIAHGTGPGTPMSWSGGGNLLVYTATGRGTRDDIWVRAMDGTAPPVSFLATAFDEDDPAMSPDGKWIAYVSNETGSAEVFLRAYPDVGSCWQVSSGGGASPLWSRDGRELFFVSGTKMMAAPIQTRPILRVGTPAMLFDGGFNTTRPHDFDIAPDGRFIAIHRAAGTGSGREIRILLNWEQDTKRMAHGRK